MKKEFKTINEIITDPVFWDSLEQEISRIRTQRYTRKDPPPGFHYKRNELDRLHEGKKLTAGFFLDNIESIWNKKSNLSSASRRIIYDVCGRALHSAIVEYEKQEESTNNEIIKQS